MSGRTSAGDDKTIDLLGPASGTGEISLSWATSESFLVYTEHPLPPAHCQ